MNSPDVKEIFQGLLTVTWLIRDGRMRNDPEMVAKWTKIYEFWRRELMILFPNPVIGA